MPEYFDTSVAVSAILPRSTRYADASARLQAAGSQAFITNHGIAEVYRTLTGPLKLPPKAAAELVADLLQAYKESPVSRSDYLGVIKDVAQKGLAGPVVYDALHAQGARNIGATKLHPYNSGHFAQVAPDLNIV